MKTWSERVEELTDEGIINTDAQGIADMEEKQGLVMPDNTFSMTELRLWGGR